MSAEHGGSSITVEFDRSSIHPGDDPAPLALAFPAKATLTDVLVALAEGGSRFFAMSDGGSRWLIARILEDGTRSTVGAVMFASHTPAEASIAVYAGDPYWARPLIEEFPPPPGGRVRLEARSFPMQKVELVKARWNSYTESGIKSVTELGYP